MAKTEREQWAAELEALLATEFKKSTDALHKLYASLLEHLKGSLASYVEQYDGLSFSKRLEVSRLFVTAQDISRALGAAEGIIYDGTIFAGKHGYGSAWYSTERILGVTLQMMGLDERYLEALVHHPIAGASFSTRLYRDQAKLAQAVNEIVARGVVEGRGYREIARSITDATEANFRSAVRIARTEAGRVRSEATQQAYEDAAQTVDGIEKRWVATLDSLTRDDHRFLDGQTVAYNAYFTDKAGLQAEAPRMFGVASEDINCRCTTEAVIDGYGSEFRRVNETGQNIKYKTYAEWAENL